MNTKPIETSRQAPPAQRGRKLSERVRWAGLTALLILAFYLLREHWNHLAGYWVYLLLLACPVIHLFHGHGSHGDHSHGPKRSDGTGERSDG